MKEGTKGRLWLMGFGLNLSAGLIHAILHNYSVSVACFVFSYFSFEMVVRNYIDRVSGETLEGDNDNEAQ